VSHRPSETTVSEDIDVFVSTTTPTPATTITIEPQEYWLVAVELIRGVTSVNWFKVFTKKEEAERYYKILLEKVPIEMKIYLAKIVRYSPIP